MKVLIVNNMAPFLWGGAEALAVHLRRNLELAGHQAEVLRIPFRWEPADVIPSQMLMCRAFEIINADRVIALKFPAYLVRHPDKVLWLLHQYRQAYDLYDVGQTNLPPGDEGKELRRVIRNGDDEAFRESRKIFTLSMITQGRLARYNGFSSEVLLQPMNDAELFCGGDYGDYIFAGGRVNSMKRQHLLIAALALTPPRVKLVVAGPPDTPADGDKLVALVQSLDVADRVKLDLRFLPRSDLAAYVNGALACAYLPFDEDSLGYVAMEAATSAKPLITTSDSGGILGLAKHAQTGWVVEPSPKALAEAMIQAVAARKRTIELGFAAKELWNCLGVTWQKTIDRLVG